MGPWLSVLLGAHKSIPSVMELGKRLKHVLQQDDSSVAVDMVQSHEQLRGCSVVFVEAIVTVVNEGEEESIAIVEEVLHTLLENSVLYVEADQCCAALLQEAVHRQLPWVADWILAQFDMTDECAWACEYVLTALDHRRSIQCMQWISWMLTRWKRDAPLVWGTIFWQGCALGNMLFVETSLPHIWRMDEALYCKGLECMVQNDFFTAVYLDHCLSHRPVSPHLLRAWLLSTWIVERTYLSVATLLTHAMPDWVPWLLPQKDMAEDQDAWRVLLDKTTSIDELLCFCRYSRRKELVQHVQSQLHAQE